MKWFEIPAELIPRLRELQITDQKYNGEGDPNEDAVVMTQCLVSAMFLTFDGRIIIDDWMDEAPPREANTLVEATIALVIGARQRNMPELLEILPSRPIDSADCEHCKTGWRELPSAVKIVCPTCGGLGWLFNKPN